MTTEILFDQRIRRLIVEETEALGKRPSYLENTINKGDVLAVVKKVIQKESSTYKKLVDIGRKDLTLESVILEPEWKDLFEAEELEICRARLET